MANLFVHFVDTLHNYVTVEIYLMLMYFCSNLNFPTQQGYIYEQVCREYITEMPSSLNNSNISCNDLPAEDTNQVKTIADYWIMSLNGLFFFPQMLTVVACGRFGLERDVKKLLPVPTIFCLLATCVYLLKSFNPNWPLWPLAIGSFLQGAGGDYVCSGMLSFRYLVVKYQSKSRTMSLSFGEAAANIGTFSGLTVCGPLMTRFGFSSVWSLNCVLYVFVLAYAFFWVKNLSPQKENAPEMNLSGACIEESVVGDDQNVENPLDCNQNDQKIGRKKGVAMFNQNEKSGTLDQNRSREARKQRKISEWSTASALGALEKELESGKKDWKRGFKFDNAATRTSVIVLVYAIATVRLSSVSEAAIFYLYTKDEPINLTQSQFSYVIGSKFFAACLGSMLLLPILSRVIHLEDVSCAIIGMVSRTLSVIYISFASSKLLISFVAVFAIPANMVAPSCRAQISKHVPNSQQIAIIFSIVAFFECLISFVGSMASSAIFPHTLHWWPGFCFAVIGAILTTGWISLLVLKCCGPKPKEDE